MLSDKIDTEEDNKSFEEEDLLPHINKTVLYNQIHDWVSSPDIANHLETVYPYGGRHIFDRENQWDSRVVEIKNRRKVNKYYL